jgi:hypothetical protein
MTDQLHSKNLVPFKKRRGGYSIPGMTAESEDRSLEQIDGDLSPEEQIFIRHYMGYADTFLKCMSERELIQEDENIAAEKSGATEMPGPDQKNAKDEAA